MSALFSILWALRAALAATPVEEAQMAELDRARAEVADEIHLAAYDLIDELVYGWATEPVFETATSVVVASVTVPVGLGTGMQAMLENHLASVIAHNPTTNIRLVHCPTCTAVVVHSGPEGTVVSRGIDNPEVLAELGGLTGQNALFIDVEAEGSWLVLRARLTRLTPDLPIVWSHTLATSASTPALLRQSGGLKSAAEAREEYVDLLRGKGPVNVLLRFAVRTYQRPRPVYYGTYTYYTEPPYTTYYSSRVASAPSQSEPGPTEPEVGTAPPPFVWLQTGVELGTTDARAWTASLVLGYSFIPDAYQGMMGQARVSRLVTGRTRSLTKPDLYLFVGAAAISVWGPATSSFQKDPVTADAILAAAEGDPPRTAFGALQIGLDLRLGNRIGMSTFLETMPDLWDSQNMGNYLRIGGLGFQSLGTEVTICF